MADRGVARMREVEQILTALRNGDFDMAIPRARSLPVEAFADIARLLEQSEDGRERRLCYRVLSHLAISSRSVAVGTYAARRAAVETQPKLILEALEVAGWTQGVTDYQPILQALDSKNHDVRRGAIRALGACQGAEAEHALLGILQNTAKPGVAALAAGGLARMGSPEAVQTLADIFPRLSRKPTDQTTLEYIIFAFARHPQALSTELVRKELDTTRLWGAGWASLHYIFQVGDETDEARVARYLNGVFQRLKRGTTVYDYFLLYIDVDLHTEITVALAALRKFAAQPIMPFAGDILALWKRLSPYDHEWILKTYGADKEFALLSFI